MKGHTKGHLFCSSFHVFSTCLKRRKEWNPEEATAKVMVMVQSHCVHSLHNATLLSHSNKYTHTGQQQQQQQHQQEQEQQKQGRQI